MKPNNLFNLAIIVPIIWIMVFTSCIAFINTSLETFDGHENGVQNVQWSSDGDHIVSTDDYEVKLWNVGGNSRIIVQDSGRFPFASIDPSGRYLAILSKNVNEIQDIRTGDTVVDLNDLLNSTVGLNSLSWSPDGTKFVVSTVSSWIFVFETENFSLTTDFESNIEWTSSIIWHPDSTSFGTFGWSSDEYVEFWEVSDTNYNQMTTPFQFSFSSGAWSPDGTLFAAADHFGDTIRIFDAETWDVIATIQGSYLSTEQPKCSPDGSRLAIITGFFSEVSIYDTVTWSQVSHIKGSSFITDISWNPEGNKLVSGNWDGKIQVWDTTRGIGILTPIFEDMFLSFLWVFIIPILFGVVVILIMKLRKDAFVLTPMNQSISALLRFMPLSYFMATLPLLKLPFYMIIIIFGLMGFSVLPMSRYFKQSNKIIVFNMKAVEVIKVLKTEFGKIWREFGFEEDGTLKITPPGAILDISRKGTLNHSLVNIQNRKSYPEVKSMVIEAIENGL